MDIQKSSYTEKVEIKLGFWEGTTYRNSVCILTNTDFKLDRGINRADHTSIHERTV